MILETILLIAVGTGAYKTGKQPGYTVGEKVGNLLDSKTRR